MQKTLMKTISWKKKYDVKVVIKGHFHIFRCDFVPIFYDRWYKMLIRSKVTNREYEPSECCFIGNPQQFIKYFINDAILYDIIPDKDKYGRDCALYVFNRRETRDLFNKWCNRELGSPAKEETMNET
jgi:hypothetical protein